MAKEKKELLQLALDAVDLSRKIILSYYNESLTVETKLDHTPVTIADRKAEEEMRRMLASRDAGFGFIGEEFGRERSRNGITWIMDPIDGTKSFIRKVPLFGTLLAGFQNGAAEVGVIDLPALGSRIWALRGEGVWLDGDPIRVSNIDSFAEGCLLTGTVNTFEQSGLGEKFHKLRQQFGLYRGWGDCFGYFQVACGRAEAMIDPIVSIWDVAPLELIFSEAGGAFSDLSGTTQMLKSVDDESLELSPVQKSSVACNAHLHKRIVNAFQ